MCHALSPVADKSVGWRELVGVKLLELPEYSVAGVNETECFIPCALEEEVVVQFRVGKV